MSEAELIGDFIFQNECSKNPAKLLTWNEGENFPSLGIGHFIWYAEGQTGPFQESFPSLLSFLEAKGVELPGWFATLPGRKAPWPDRDGFIKARENLELAFLTEFLLQTKKYQAEFMVERFTNAVPAVLRAANQKLKIEMSQKLSLMIHSTKGLYALVDYVNSRGEGILKTERYKGKGWGLLQVLEQMQVPQNSEEAISEFVKAAEIVLNRRIENSPPKRNEIRWLPGWQNRINSYLAFPEDDTAFQDRLPREPLLQSISDSLQVTESADLALSI